SSYLYFWLRPPPTSTLFPYTTLFRSRIGRRLVAFDLHEADIVRTIVPDPWRARRGRIRGRGDGRQRLVVDFDQLRGVHGVVRGLDRKSTRLNSSHRTISYAVFCLKKK